MDDLLSTVQGASLMDSIVPVAMSEWKNKPIEMGVAP